MQVFLFSKKRTKKKKKERKSEKIDEKNEKKSKSTLVFFITCLCKMFIVLVVSLSHFTITCIACLFIFNEFSCFLNTSKLIRRWMFIAIQWEVYCIWND